MNANKKPVSIRFEPRLLDDANAVVKDLEAEVDMDLSAYIRYMVRFDAALWRRSPYVAVSSQVTALVDPSGRVALHRLDRLRLNRDVVTVPCRLAMKPAKVAEYLAGVPVGGEGTALLSRWRLVAFDLVSDAGQVIDAVRDPVGLSAKAAELRADRPAGTFLTRRSVAVLDDYAQWHARGADPLSSDAIEVDVTVPTMGFDLCVVLDHRLFAHTRRFDADFVPRLEDRLLGTDGQPLDGVSIEERSHDSTFIRKWGGSWGRPAAPGGAAEDARPVVERLDGLVRAAEAVGEPGLVALPEAAVFHRIRLARVRMGLKVAVRWPRPERPRARV